MDPKNVVSKQKCIDYIEKNLYNQQMFVWTLQTDLVNMVFVSDLSNSIIYSLWIISTSYFLFFQRFIVLGFNYTSILVVHFVLSPREREKRDRRDNGGDERKGQGRKRNRNKSEETEEKETFPLYSFCKPVSVGCPGDVRYMTPSTH